MPMVAHAREDQRQQDSAAGTAPPAPGPRPPEFALLFELEGSAVNGRQAAFDVIKRMLGQQRISFGPAQFVRHCLHPLPQFYVPQMLEALEAKKMPAEEFLAGVQQGLEEFYSSRGATLDRHLDKLMDLAAERQIAIGALSVLPGSGAPALAAKLGLTDRGVQVFTFDDVQPVYPRADTWLKVAKAMGKYPRRCVVLATSSPSCKSALSAGMRCVAIPDQFTSFQDFGGAEMTLDSLADCDLGELLDMLLPGTVAK